MTISATRVTFPSGALTGSGTVVAARADDLGAVVVLDETPFHPVDHTWPDQPGDLGALTADGQAVAVTDTLMAAISDADGTLALGGDIPVKRGEDGWTWLVAHRLAETAVPNALAVGTAVHADVNELHRAALSRGHSACHLASLALNAAIAPLWSKPTREDALGRPDFDARANQTSRIVADGSVDEYRLGKSLRKAGVDTATLLEDLDLVRARANATLASWVSAGGVSAIEVDGPTIVDRRTWVAQLPEGEARILCGGTHVADLSAFAHITIDFSTPDDQTLVMTTTVVPS